MAVIDLVSDNSALDTYTYTWETMGNDDTGGPLQSPALSDKTVTITGTYAGATVTIKGSNDGTNYMTLTGADSTEDLSFTSGNQVAIITENPLYIRPETAGGAGTDLDIIIVAKRA